MGAMHSGGMLSTLRMSHAFTNSLPRALVYPEIHQRGRRVCPRGRESVLGIHK